MPQYTFDLTYTPPDFTRPMFEQAPDKEMEPSAADGLAPTTFYSTTNFPTYVKRGGQWHLVKRQRMDACVVWDEKAQEFACVELRRVRAGQSGAAPERERRNGPYAGHASSAGPVRAWWPIQTCPSANRSAFQIGARAFVSSIA